MLQQGRFVHKGRFSPEYVICDAGYSSSALRHAIRQQYHSTPVIDPNPTHKKSVMKFPNPKKDPEYKLIYNRRTSVERINGRLKGFYKLNDVRVRGLMKVTLHALLSATVLLAAAVANPSMPRTCIVSVSV